MSVLPNTNQQAYANLSSRSANGDETAVHRFADIPQQILKNVSLPERERSYECFSAHSAHSLIRIRRLVAEREFIKHVLPMPATDSAEAEASWAERLLIVTSYLDAGAQKTLHKLGRLFERRPSMYAMYLDAAEKYNVCSSVFD